MKFGNEGYYLALTLTMVRSLLFPVHYGSDTPGYSQVLMGTSVTLTSLWKTVLDTRQVPNFLPDFVCVCCVHCVRVCITFAYMSWILADSFMAEDWNYGCIFCTPLISHQLTTHKIHIITSWFPFWSMYKIFTYFPFPVWTGLELTKPMPPFQQSVLQGIGHVYRGPGNERLKDLCKISGA